MKFFFSRTLLMAGLLALLTVSAAFAQSDATPLSLSLSRDFGYGGLSGEIQGTFSLRVEGPADLAAVRYYVDDALFAEVSEPPFSYQFNTDSISPGERTFSAVGTLADGSEVHSNPVTALVLTQEEASQATKGLLVPLLGFILGATVLSAVVPFLFRKNKKPTLGNYGAAGAAICRHCGRPFARPLFGVNLIAGRLSRCPHCGKWSVARRVFGDELAEAEARWQAEMEDDALGGPKKEEDDLKRMLDESRYDG